MSSITAQPPIPDAGDAIQQRQKRVAVSVYGWPRPDGGNLGLQVTGQATRHGDACGGWQRYTVRPAEVWCFGSRTGHERHRISTR